MPMNRNGRLERSNTWGSSGQAMMTFSLTLIVLLTCPVSAAGSSLNADVLNMKKSSNFSFAFGKSDLSDLENQIYIDVSEGASSAIWSLIRRQTNQDVQYLYPYVLQLSHSRQSNDGLQVNYTQSDVSEDENLMRSLVLMGYSPEVEIEYKPFSDRGKMASSTHKVLQTVVLNSMTLSDVCDASLCKPVWVVPLLVSKENFVFDIHLYSHGMAPLPDHIVEQKFLSGFSENKSALFSALGKVVEKPAAANVFGNISWISRIPSLTATFSISPIIDDSHYIIGHHDDSFLQVMQASDSLVGLDLCNCQSASPSIHVLTLPDRVLIAHKTGVWEIAGNFSMQNSQIMSWLWKNRVGKSWRILDKCIKKFAMSSSAVAPKGWRILGVGGCSDEDEVFVAGYNARQDSPILFQSLSGNLICAAADSLSECHVLDACVRPVGFEDFFFLLGDSREGSSSYELLHINPADGYNKSVHPEILASRFSPDDASSRPNISDFHLSGISSTGSNTLLMWGDVLLISQDDGESWEMLSNFSDNEIILLSTLFDSFFYLVTKNQEIWAGGSHSEKVIKIYPTYSFSLLTGCLLSPEDSHIVALLSDVNGNLIVIYFDKTDSWNIKSCQGKSRLDEIMSHVAFIDRWEEQLKRSLHNTGQNTPVAVEDECPYEFIQMLVIMNKRGSVTQETTYRYGAPVETAERPTLSQDRLLLHSMTIKSLETHRAVGGADIGVSRNSVEVWKKTVRGHARYQQYLIWLNQTAHPFYFNSNGYQQVYESDKKEAAVPVSPKYIFLDYNQVASLALHVQIRDSAVDPEKLQLTVDTGVRRNLEIDVNKTVHYLENAVDFQISVQDLQDVKDQFPPGGNLGLTHVDLKILPTSFQCESNSITEVNQQTAWSLSVITGCPPTSTLIFDYKTSQRFLATIREAYFDCQHPTPDVPCFYFNTPFYPFFAYLDDADGYWKNFTGNYTLTVVGVTENSPDNVQVFTEEKIISFNSMLAHPSQNVWGPVDGQANTTEEGLPIYNSHHRGMSFFCQPKSPCANIMPGIVSAPEIFVLVEFSNKGVDSSTHCDFTTQFLMRVHGLPINTVHMSLILTLWGLAVQFAFILLYILCYCQVDPWNKSVWTRLQERFPFLQKKKVEPLVDWRTIVERRMRVATATSGDSDISTLSEGGHFVTMRKKQPRDTSIIKVIYED